MWKLATVSLLSFIWFLLSPGNVLECVIICCESYMQKGQGVVTFYIYEYDKLNNIMEMKRSMTCFYGWGGGGEQVNKMLINVACPSTSEVNNLSATYYETECTVLCSKVPITVLYSTPLTLLRSLVQWLRLAFSKGPNRVGVSPSHLRMETSSFWMLCFLVYRIPYDGQSPDTRYCWMLHTIIRIFQFLLLFCYSLLPLCPLLTCVCMHPGSHIQSNYFLFFLWKNIYFCSFKSCVGFGISELFVPACRSLCLDWWPACISMVPALLNHRE
jgi:hypothetical protein